MTRQIEGIHLVFLCHGFFVQGDDAVHGMLVIQVPGGIIGIGQAREGSGHDGRLFIVGIQF